MIIIIINFDMFYKEGCINNQYASSINSIIILKFTRLLSAKTTCFERL